MKVSSIENTGLGIICGRKRTSACIYDFILGCSHDDQCRISDIDEDDDLARRRNIDPTAALTKYRHQLKSNYLCKKSLVLKGLY